MSQDENHRAKLLRLADALMQDIIASSDADILAEIDVADIKQARAIFIEAKAHVSKRSLITAKIGIDEWRSARSHSSRPPLALNDARQCFDKIRRADPNFNQKVLLAARNGSAPTDTDKEGLVEDLADLQRLEDEDSL
jgi:hypothetical protein